MRTICLNINCKMNIIILSQDAPEIDGLVYIKNNFKEDLLNKFVTVKIEKVNDYDLIGKII